LVEHQNLPIPQAVSTFENLSIVRPGELWAVIDSGR